MIFSLFLLPSLLLVILCLPHLTTCLPDLSLTCSQSKRRRPYQLHLLQRHFCSSIKTSRAVHNSRKHIASHNIHSRNLVDKHFFSQHYLIRNLQKICKIPKPKTQYPKNLKPKFRPFGFIGSMCFYFRSF